MDRPLWTPNDSDAMRPSSSRVYDYLLGGSHNFAVDRRLAAQLLAADPQTARYAQVNRAFLNRAVRFTVRQGVRQFLDLGSGIPSVGSVHDAAQALAPESHVVYVDNDPVVIAYGREILAGNVGCGVLEGDLQHPAEILTSKVVRELVDFGKPIAVLMLAVLHFVPDEADPAAIVGRYVDAMATGSYLAISQAAPPRPDAVETGARARDTYEHSARPLTLRTRDELVALFGPRLRLVSPGLVDIGSWRPEPGEDEFAPVPGYAGVAVKTG